MQVDSLATARDGDIHEATRRLLSVLLRQVMLGLSDFSIQERNLICGFSVFQVKTNQAVFHQHCTTCTLQIDGFEQEKKVVVIAATNRKQDLDPALLR